MLSALHVLVAAGCLLILSTSASDVAPQTTALSYAGQKRAGSVPTVTLGPSSTYITDVVISEPHFDLYIRLNTNRASASQLQVMMALSSCPLALKLKMESTLSWAPISERKWKVL